MLGRSGPAVTAYELGYCRPSVEVERRLRKLLQRPPPGWKPPPPPPPPPPPKPVVAPFDPAELRRWRRDGRVTLKKLGRQLGVDPSAIHRWERGITRPREEYRAELERLLARRPPVALRAEPRQGARGRRRSRWESLRPAQLVAWRRDRGLSRASMACALGVSEGTLFGWERGKTVPNVRTQRRLIAALRGDQPPAAPSGTASIRGPAITAWRKRRGWSRRELAAALDVGEATVAAWEHGERSPTRRPAQRLRALLEHGKVPAGTRIRWELVTVKELRRLLRVSPRGVVAEALGVEVEDVRRWEAGFAAPPRPAQRKLASLVAKLAGHRPASRR